MPHFSQLGGSTSSRGGLGLVGCAAQTQAPKHSSKVVFLRPRKRKDGWFPTRYPSNMWACCLRVCRGAQEPGLVKQLFLRIYEFA